MLTEKVEHVRPMVPGFEVPTVPVPLEGGRASGTGPASRFEAGCQPHRPDGPGIQVWSIRSASAPGGEPPSIIATADSPQATDHATESVTGPGAP